MPFDLSKLHSLISEDIPPAFSGFRPGTLVWTNQGENSIEHLEENGSIHTRTSPTQYVLRSDERVFTMIPSRKTVLLAINKEDPFFTLNHVFYTTTGLRAVYPDGARQEDPWLSVGVLKVGHVLLRASGGKFYERKAVQSVNTTVEECEAVYGVHLREGLHSYHANGYVVHLNYPEITISSIANTL